MLSAVAARKAAMVAADTAQPASPSKSSSSTTGGTVTSSPAPVKPSSRKRKSSSQTQVIGSSPFSSNPKAAASKRAKHRSVVDSGVSSRYGGRESRPSRPLEEDIIPFDADDSDTEKSEPLTPPDSDSEMGRDESALTSVVMKRAWSPSQPLADSSDEDEPTVVTIEERHLPPEPAAFSTFDPATGINTFSIPGDTPAVAIILRPDEIITLLGVYNLVVLRGSISFSGTTLTQSNAEIRVFAPRCSPVSPIRSVPSAHERENDSGALPPGVAANLRTGDSVLLLRSLATGIEALGSIIKPFEGVFRPAAHRGIHEGAELNLPGVYMVTQQTSEIEPFVLPISWGNAFESVAQSSLSSDTRIAEPQVYLIRGPKKVGKSTFARVLLNNLITRYRRVAFLECDLGQSEFSPAGMVTLNIISHPIFGPSFSHPTIPYVAHYIGAISPRDSPTQYIAAIEACLQTYRLDVRFNGNLEPYKQDEDGRISDGIPLVVNTMGWTKGLGADLNAQIFIAAAPTVDFSFESPSSIGMYVEAAGMSDLSSSNLSDATTYVLEPVFGTRLATRFTASDYRNLNILSYMHAIFAPSGTEDLMRDIIATSWTSTTLRRRVPYTVDWRTAFDVLRLCAPGAEDIMPSEIARVLNGALVALVESEPGSLADEYDVSPEDTAPEWGYVRAAHLPAPDTSRCVGLALVRGVSLATGAPIVTQVLTPLPPAALARCRVVVKGALALPIWGMLDGNDTRETPYLRWGSGSGSTGSGGVIGDQARRVRRNLMRKGQL